MRSHAPITAFLLLAGCANQNRVPATPLANELASGLNAAFVGPNASQMQFEQETNRGRGVLTSPVRDASLHVVRVRQDIIVDALQVNLAPIEFTTDTPIAFVDIELELRGNSPLTMRENRVNVVRAVGELALTIHFRIRWPDESLSDVNTLELPASAATLEMRRAPDGVETSLELTPRNSTPFASWLGLLELSNFSLTLRNEPVLM